MMCIVEMFLAFIAITVPLIAARTFINLGQPDLAIFFGCCAIPFALLYLVFHAKGMHKPSQSR
jgi:hypothetical protein